jgi:hypothetical protein
MAAGQLTGCNDPGDDTMLLDIFTAIDKSFLGELIRASTWAFAAIEVVHLIGLTVLLGTILVVNMRLMGIGLTQQSLQEIAALTMPWTYIGTVITLGSGILLFVSEALKCYGSPPFFWKMGLLLLAMIATFFLQVRLARGKPKSLSPSMGKLAGVVTITLWLGVGFAGRAIAFF